MMDIFLKQKYDSLKESIVTLNCYIGGENSTH